MKAHICRKTDQRPEYLRTNPLPRLKGQSSKSRNVLHWPVKVELYMCTDWNFFFLFFFATKKKSRFFCGKIVDLKPEISTIAFSWQKIRESKIFIKEVTRDDCTKYYYGERENFSFFYNVTEIVDKNFVKSTFVWKKLLELISRNICTVKEKIFRFSTLWRKGPDKMFQTQLNCAPYVAPSDLKEIQHLVRAFLTKISWK